MTEADALAADTNVITRAVGGQPDLTLDVAIIDVCSEDTFLLCSDGLYRELEHDVICSELSGGVLDDVAANLLSRALAGAARDNVAWVVARPVAP